MMKNDSNELNVTKEELSAELKRLKNSYKMYERSKKETSDKLNKIDETNGNSVYDKDSIDNTIELITNMMDEIKNDYIILGGDEKDLTIDNEDDNLIDSEKINQNNGFNNDVLNYLETLSTENMNIKKKNQNTFDSFDVSKVKCPFDTIPLPSNGECYTDGLSRIPVAYLTAYDENIIISPNLYRDGKFIDYLLRAKILNPSINPDNLLPGDRDAIILWLRATGYGNDFPVSVTDNETGKNFKSVVDLSKIKYKEFSLKSDEKGWFSFVLPVSKDEIKFTFLTFGEIQRLNEIEEKENLSIKQKDLQTISEKLQHLKNEDLSNTVNKLFGKRIDDAIKTIDEWYDLIEPDVDTQISHSITNKMIASIKSINGIEDPKYIKEYVVKMNIRDSASFRKYMLDNEPGLDFTIEVERPASLGGGSMTTFLTLDQYVFLNYSE